jgi:type IV pilus assembly protein PilC
MATGMHYRYEAIDAEGNRRKGMLDASDRDAARVLLRAQGLAAVSLTEAAGAARRRSVTSLDIGDLLRGGKPKTWKVAKVAEFARQLHQLLRAGLPISEALKSMAESYTERDAELCVDLAAAVESGSPLALAMSRHEHAFNEVFVSYIETAERSGSLVETTGRLANMLEQRASIDRKVQAVTIYPKLVASIIGVILIAVIVFMVPMYIRIYDQFNSEIPGITKALAGFASILSPWHVDISFSFPFVRRQTNHTWLTSPLNLASPMFWTALIIFGARKFLRANRSNPKIAIPWNRLVFRLPVFGKLSAKMAAFRWSSTMAGALKAGLRVPEALRLAGRASGSAWHALAAEELADAVISGRPLSDAMLDHPGLFSPQTVAMTLTGERAGDLPEMLDGVSVAVTDDINAHIATMGAKIEVGLLVAMGVVVGGLLAVLYLPILNLVSTIQENLSRR